jgi:sterol desaturase/sphingolipid hydroxylase (fatty acid hydroxylase superfamily)
VSQIIYFSIPAFILLIGAELLYARITRQQLYEWRDTLANLAMGLGNVIISAGWKAVVWGAVFFGLYQYRLFDIPMTAVWAWALILVLEDFCYYWFHRLHHEVRCLWAAHVNHHSSEHLNLAVALRQSWTTPMTGMLFWAPLALLGFHPLMILTQQAISLLYQFWIHTQAIKSLGPLEWVLNTPAHHRVHHGSNPQYLDRNYAGIFIVWDRLFGTFEPEREPVRYGLTHNIKTFNPVRIAFHEWAAIAREVRASRSWREALYRIFGRPSRMQPVGTSPHSDL